MDAPIWASTLVWSLAIVSAWRHMAVLKLVVMATPTMVFSALTTLIIGAAIIGGTAVSGDIAFAKQLGSYWGTWVYMWAASVLGPYLIMAGCSVTAACAYGFITTVTTPQHTIKRKREDIRAENNSQLALIDSEQPIDLSIPMEQLYKAFKETSQW
jgi:hypothetical protein